MKRLIEAAEIREKVAVIGSRVTEDYAGRPLTVIGVLTGGLMLVSDLVRSIELPLRVGMIHASSYRDGSVAGQLKLDDGLLPDIRGRHVLIVDDIFDTGHTLTAVVERIRIAGAVSVRVAVLLRKERPRTVEWEPDYIGFTIPDVFVVGYGLDYKDDYRSLPYVAALEECDF